MNTRQQENLVRDVIVFFSTMNNGIVNPDRTKCTLNDFCKEYELDYLPNDVFSIMRVCDQLVDKGYLICEYIGSPSVLMTDRRYLSLINNYESASTDVKVKVNSKVWGFPYIHSTFSECVLPISYKKDAVGAEGEKTYDLDLGTCFRYRNGLATARHCLIDPTDVSIKGYSAEQLNNGKVYVSDDDAVDVAYIDLGLENSFLLPSTPKILDEIIAMGYPKIPRFAETLTVDKASIAGILNTRKRVTSGSIVAKAQEHYTPFDTFLISARVQGGNSGGPVINSSGEVVGIICRNSYSQKSERDNYQYDEMGLGEMIPIHVLDEVIATCTHHPKINFYDFQT